MKMSKPKGNYANTGMAKLALGMGRQGVKTMPKMKTVLPKKGAAKGASKYWGKK